MELATQSATVSRIQSDQVSSKSDKKQKSFINI